MQGRKMRESRKAFEWRFLIASIVFSVISTVAAEIIYIQMMDNLYGPVLISLTVMIFFLLLALFIMIYSKITGRYQKEEKETKRGLVLITFLSLVFILSFIFEWIYERDLASNKTTSYIFLLDDSGTMKVNDESFVRYQALKTIMQNETTEFPYAIYSFSDDLQIVREMAPRGVNTQQYSMDPDRFMGRTQMLHALSDILDNIVSGKINGGKNPKVILLSDGEPTDGDKDDFQPIIKRYASKNIVISTIGLNAGAKEGFLQWIAESTGGAYLEAKDETQLQAGMQAAAKGLHSRNLLGYRGVMRNSWIYSIERMIFMALLGAIIGISPLWLSYIMPQQLTLYAAIVKGILAGILLEIFLEVFNSPVSFVNVIYFLLIGIVLAQKYVRAERRRINWQDARRERSDKTGVDESKKNEDGESMSNNNLNSKGEEAKAKDFIGIIK